MKIGPLRFNLYLVFALALLCAGCKSTEEKRKEHSTLRFHLESNQDGTERNHGIPVYRANPVLVNVERRPYLDEAHVLGTTLMETPGGGFAIQVKFDRQGSWLLERASVTHKGRRIAVFSEFNGQSRWLAAPVMNRIINNGILTFTPDATPEEAEIIVAGVNKLSKKLQKADSWGW